MKATVSLFQRNAKIHFFL